MSCDHFGVTMEDVHQAVADSNLNATGGYLDQRGGNELLVRGIGRVTTLNDLQTSQLDDSRGTNRHAERCRRDRQRPPKSNAGDASAFVRDADGKIDGGPAVVLTINKQPGSDTRAVDEAIGETLKMLQESLPSDIRIANVYSQRIVSLTARSITSSRRWPMAEFWSSLILFLFLLNFRTTFITLTAIPLSIVATACVFAAFGLSINTMTLGGLAVAIGELVDDAIVDVENIFRRLRENRDLPISMADADGCLASQ